MCGIAGIVRLDDRPIDRDCAERMLAHLRHRGPDGEGISHHERCTLVHARLSIIDLLSGKQPMHLESGEDASAEAASAGGLHLVFNGEIYNHRQLRELLEKRGHRFHSDHSDTEVLLLGYREWGTELPKHLHGMFAFAIWDADAQRLFLVRDRIGKKPLYLQRTADQITFASLVATLVAGTGSASVCGESLLTFLRYGYPFERSMVAGIEEVPPAHWMSLDRNGTVRTQRYWQPPPVSKATTAMGAVDALHEVLSDSVRSRLQADVPLAAFLSGGIDSSIIAAMAQRHLVDKNSPPLRTFSVAMPQLDYDESSHAQVVADHIGSHHTVLTADPTDAIADLQHLMTVTGEPTADSSLLPTYWLCRATRQHVKVALSGDGGDELFGGYDRYRALRWLRQWRVMVAAMPPSWLGDVNPRSRRTRLRRLVLAARAGADPAQQYHRMIHLFTDDQIRELGVIPADAAMGPTAVPDWSPEQDVVHTAMRWDLTHYLPFELLRKIDRASMAVALEVRCPLLDTQVADLAGHLPSRVLMPGGRPKGLLRALAVQYLPLRIVNRPKRGFAIPIGHWLRTTLRDPLADHILGGQLDGLGFDRRAIRRYFEDHIEQRSDHSHRLFALLQLSLWTQWLRQR